MEPVFMILGQSAATMAVISLEEHKGLHDISYDILAAQLQEDGQVLELKRD
jgi:hypothetical protein